LLNNKLILQKNSIVKYFFIFSLMPFFSFYPVDSDVQPVFLLFAGILFLYTKKKFDFFELSLLIVAIFSIFYINIEAPNISIRKSFNLLFVFLLFYIIKRYIHLFNAKLLFIIVNINFFALLFHLLTPSLFVHTLGKFTRVVKILDPLESARGASGFAAEPGFMGTLTVFYIMLAFYLRDFKNDVYKFKLTILLGILMLLITKSGSAIFFGLIFVVTYFSKSIFKIKGLAIMIVLILFFIFLFFYSDINFGRLSQVLTHIFTNPELLFFVDTSVGQRTTNVLVGILAPFEFPFGNGAFSYNFVSDYLINNYSIFEHIQGSKGNISDFAKYSSELGLIFIYLLIYLTYEIFKSGFMVQKFSFYFIGILMLLDSYSIIFPPMWILFVIAMRMRYEK
jgi:hypothetical protein